MLKSEIEKKSFFNGKKNPTQYGLLVNLATMDISLR